MASKRGQDRTRVRRPRREGGPLTVFDLSRDYRLAPIEVAAPVDLAPARDARARWILELAWDGHRVLACTLGDEVRLVSSDFREWADVFPTVGMALRRLRLEDAVIEGWICALDAGGEKGRSAPSFERLRLHAQKQSQKIVFAAWDLLRVDGEDLRSRPLHERRNRLLELLPTAKGDALVASESLHGSVDALLAGVRSIGGRGIVARDGEASYPVERLKSAAETSWLAVSCGDEDLEIERQLSPPPVVTNQDKLMFPRDAIAKRDVVAYYEEVASVLLRYTKDRPIVGQRWPDGIDEFTWYQHRMPPRAPDYLRAVWIEGNRRICVENRDALLWLANQAVLTFHAWSSRVATLANPDWAVIDLDPGESTTWAQTIEVAIGLRKLLELLELPSVPKTSGQRGIHVLVPLGPGHNVIQAHELARRASKMIAKVLPHLVSIESARDDRGGRLYLDHLQNFVGKSLVLPYSLRAIDGAPVSTPLAWSEVTPRLDPRAFTLRTLRRRLDAHGDLAAPLLEGTADLTKVIARMEP
ncbi:MAG: ATP-dependent ligase [Labilithrix sp.]|nr:ATP-dependent ligase [Labilithrix sp.]